MVADRAGNRFTTARRVILSATPKSFRDFIGGKDLDYYRFRVANRSSFSLALRELTANANVALYDQRGSLLKKSIRPGKRAEAIQQTLEAGIYYVLVYPQPRNQKTNYRLVMSATPTAEQPVNSPFNIRFDYRFDTKKWFTAQKKAALEAAADVWERIISDEFANKPIGTKTPYVINPETGDYLDGDFRSDTVIDDVLIFVGARNLRGTYGTTLALSGPSGYFPDENRYAGSDFEPWIGSMSFDRSTDWFVDPTPSTAGDIPSDRQDFIGTAVHEIAHVLGFGTSRAFNNLEQGGAFEGSNARDRNDGDSIPLSGSSHIQDGFELSGTGEPLMSPFSDRGVRKLPTVLDIAILDDIGYQVDYSAAAVNSPTQAQRSRLAKASRTSSLPMAAQQVRSPFHRRQGAIASTYGTCGCASCLMGQTRLSSLRSS